MPVGHGINLNNMNLIKYSILIVSCFVNSNLFSTNLNIPDHPDLKRTKIALAGTTVAFLSLTLYAVDNLLNSSPKPSFRRSIMKICQTGASACAAIGILHGRYGKWYALVTSGLSASSLMISLYDSFHPEYSDNKNKKIV